MTEIERARAIVAPFLSDRPYRFDSARDAIDSVSRFESLTLDNWEYRLEASETDDVFSYRVSLNNLFDMADQPVFRFRGYLTFVPRDEAGQ